MKEFKEINFSPYATNVLDWQYEEGLITKDGRNVMIKRYNMEFIITIGKEEYRTYTNVEASYILNKNQTGTLV
jgi:hypothetical protein